MFGGFNPFALAAGVLSGGAQIGSSLINRESTRDTNRTNVALARENQKFVSDQALRQMNFQERMSNTAVSRHMKDMQRAGLHPSLAAGGGTAPGGAAGSASAPVMQAPQIHLPDLFAMGVSLKQLEQMDTKLMIEGKKAAADITKTLSDKDLNKMKEVMLQKGMPRAMAEGEIGQVFRSIIQMIKENARKPRLFPFVIDEQAPVPMK